MHFDATILKKLAAEEFRRMSIGESVWTMDYESQNGIGRTEMEVIRSITELFNLEVHIFTTGNVKPQIVRSAVPPKYEDGRLVEGSRMMVCLFMQNLPDRVQFTILWHHRPLPCFVWNLSFCMISVFSYLTLRFSE